MDFAPPSTLITIVKKAPRKVTNAIDNSWVGQKMIDAGTQASGGIGRNISKDGAQVSSGTTSLSVNASTLAKGNYVLLIRGKDIIQEKQFIKE